MATSDIRIDIRIERLENEVRLLDVGQKRILDKIDELFARQDELSAKLDKLLAKQDALFPKQDERGILENIGEMKEQLMSLQSNEL